MITALIVIGIIATLAGGGWLVLYLARRKLEKQLENIIEAGLSEEYQELMGQMEEWMESEEGKKQIVELEEWMESEEGQKTIREAEQMWSGWIEELDNAPSRSTDVVRLMEELDNSDGRAGHLRLDELDIKK